MLIWAKIIGGFRCSFFHVTALCHIVNYSTTYTNLLWFKVCLVHLDHTIFLFWWMHQRWFLLVFADWSITLAWVWLIFISRHTSSISLAIQLFILPISLLFKHTFKILKAIIYRLLLPPLILYLNWFLFLIFIQIKFLSGYLWLLIFVIGPRFLFLGIWTFSSSIVRQRFSWFSWVFSVLLVEHSESWWIVWRLVDEVNMLGTSHDDIVFGSSNHHLSWLHDYLLASHLTISGWCVHKFVRCLHI